MIVIPGPDTALTIRTSGGRIGVPLWEPSRRRFDGAGAPSQAAPSAARHLGIAQVVEHPRSVAVARAGDVLRRPRVRRAIEGVTGLALVALGLRVATERS